MSNEQANTMHSTADDLMIRCRQGDRRAFNQLIQTYQDQVFTYLFHLTEDEGAAQKMTEQTFVAAYKGLKRYPNTFSIKGWLLSLAEQQLRQRERGPYTWFAAFFSKWKTPSRPNGEGQGNFETTEHSMPDCASISPLLSAYLDGELGELDAKRVERHLKQCEPCQQTYDDLVDTLNILQTFGHHQALPDLRVHINAALDESFSWWNSLAHGFNVSGSRIVSVMAMLMVVFSVLIVSNQHRYIQQLEQKFVSDTRRGGSPVGSQPPKTTFVILTGASTLKDMLLADAGWLSKHITASREETELLFIQGTQEELGRMIAERIQAIEGNIIHEERLQEQSFHVLTLTVEVPENISEFFLSILRPLDVEQATSQRNVNTTTVKIMIIEKP